MARTELPWLLFGRKVRPFALSLSLATAVLAATILTNSSVWGDEGDTWSVIVAALSIVATILLWAGFWIPSTALMQHGLMISAIVFAVRGTYIGLQGPTSTWWTAALSYTWVIAAGGAWLLEGTTGDHLAMSQSGDVFLMDADENQIGEWRSGDGE